jgi:alkaline phosphatase D
MPLRWHYNNPRVGDLLLVAHPGYYFQILSKNFGNVKYPVFGVHGYDPAEVPEMNGIFYACGPNIKTGATLPAFENVHIYPFVARLLGIQPPVTDGDLSVLNPIYKK